MKNYYLYGLVCLLLCLFTTTHATAQKSRTSKAYKKAQKKKKRAERRAKLDQYLGTPNTTQKKSEIDVRRNQKKPTTVDVRRNKSNIPPSTKTNRKTPTKTKKRGRKDYQQVQLIDNAKVYLGTPYQWGGNGGKGFDCSGLTQTVFKKAGYNLPRTAQEQSQAGRKISLSKVEKGDLVFFGKRNKITHVGIVVSGKREPLKIIHATSSEGVTITNINKSTYWKKRLKKAIRVIG